MSEKAISKILTGALKYCHWSESYGELNDCMFERSGSMVELPIAGKQSLAFSWEKKVASWDDI